MHKLYDGEGDHIDSAPPKALTALAFDSVF
jgi:hypothetical protein